MPLTRDFIHGTPQELLREYGADILEAPEFLAMKEYVQHKNSTAYAHSIAVAVKAIELAKNLKIKVHARSLVRGALLHDYWLYDCHAKNHPRFHLIRHGHFAAINAAKQFGINPIEEDMIANHMWPIHPFRFPLCIEGWILISADKEISFRERFPKKKKQKDIQENI